MDNLLVFFGSKPNQFSSTLHPEQAEHPEAFDSNVYLAFHIVFYSLSDAISVPFIHIYQPYLLSKTLVLYNKIISYISQIFKIKILFIRFTLTRYKKCIIMPQC